MTKTSLLNAFKAACLVLVFFSSQFSVFAQSQTAEQNQSQNQVVSDSAQNSPNVAVNSSAQTWNWSNENFAENQKQPSTIGLFFKMVFALLFVLALAYIAMRILKRTTKLSNSDDPFLRHVSHLSLSASRSVDVVTILDHAYILGVSDNAVNLVGEITDKELVDSMNLYADKNDNTKRPRSFEDILSIFMPNSQTSKNENVYGSSAWQASEMLRRQRERFNNGEEE